MEFLEIKNLLNEAFDPHGVEYNYKESYLFFKVKLPNGNWFYGQLSGTFLEELGEGEELYVSTLKEQITEYNVAASTWTLEVAIKESLGESPCEIVVGENNTMVTVNLPNDTIVYAELPYNPRTTSGQVNLEPLKQAIAEAHPGKLNLYNVKVIPAEAFIGRSDIHGIVFGSGLKEIQEKAFCRCTNIEDLVFPEGLRKIDKKAFLKCENLKSVKLPSSIKYVGDNAFSLTPNLQIAEVKDCNAEFAGFAFNDCCGENRLMDMTITWPKDTTPTI